MAKSTDMMDPFTLENGKLARLMVMESISQRKDPFMKESSVTTELKDRENTLQEVSIMKATFRTINSMEKALKEVVSTNSMGISGMEKKRMGNLFGMMEVRITNTTVALMRKEDSQEMVILLRFRQAE